MSDVRGSWWKLQVQIKRFAGQQDACERESDQHQHHGDKQYQKTHAERLFIIGRKAIPPLQENSDLAGEIIPCHHQPEWNQAIKILTTDLFLKLD